MIFTYFKKQSLLSALLAFIMVFSMSFELFDISAQAVSKSELDILKQQQEQLAKEKADIQAQADETSGKVSSQTEKLDFLSSQLKITDSEIKNLSRQIVIYTNSIAQMENQLNIDKQKEQELIVRYKKRMRAMEENGSYTYLTILLGASSFEDLLSRIDCINEIMEYDDRLVKDVQEAQIQVENAKADMEEQCEAQEQAIESYQEKQTDIMAQQEEVQVVLLSLMADSEDYDKQLESVKTLQSSLGGQISSMESQLAELERIKAEQAASAQPPSSGNSGSWYGDSVGSGSGQDIVDFAETFLGVKYVYGGTSPSGFDCSGLVYYCYKHFGYTVNRTAAGLAYSGTSVSSSQLQAGDIILFTSQDGSYIGHTGIYIGNGQFIHAPHTGDVVKISSLSDSYYASHYYGARRVVS